MPVTAKVEPLEKDVGVFLMQDLSPAARSRAFADYARETLAETEQSNAEALGRVPPHVTFVDGRAGADEASVSPDGTIVYEFELAQQMLEWIDEQLRIHSPVKSGAYRAAHRMFLDGTEINTGSFAGVERGEVVFINVEPYARKIERGESPSAPDGVYEVVAALARQRFGNLAKIAFAYRAPIGGGSPLDSWANSTGQKRAGRKIAVSHWNRRQPAIIVTLR